MGRASGANKALVGLGALAVGVAGFLTLRRREAGGGGGADGGAFQAPAPTTKEQARQHSIGNLQVHYARMESTGVGALNPGSGLPITVYHGESVLVDKAEFSYQGPGGPVYLCWGLKKRDTGIIPTGVDFNNGGGLEGGVTRFGAGRITLEPAPDRVNLSLSARARLEILPDVPAGHGRVYDTFVWVSTERSAREAAFLKRQGANEGLIDTDAGVIRVLPSQETGGSRVHAISGLNVRYRIEG